MRLQNCKPVEEFCVNFLNLTGLHYQLLSPQRPRSRSSRVQLLIEADTRRYECQVHGIHKFCNEISIVYSVCSTCHNCIFFLVFRVWMIFFYGFAVSNKPQCPPQL